MKITPSTFYPRLCLLILTVLAASQVQAKVLMDFDADFTPPNIKPGLRFLWNPEGVKIGEHQKYKELSLVQPANYYIAEAGKEPGPKSISTTASWLKVYRLTRNPNKAPVPGVEYDVIRVAPGNAASFSSDKLDHFVIIAYTIQPGEAGDAAITGSSLTRIRAEESSQIKLYLNDRLIGEDALSDIGPSQFDVSLGKVNVGDTIYVALGPSKTTSIGWIPQLKIESK